MGPVAVTPMGTRHVVGHRGRTVRALASRMGGDQFAAMEDLHRLRRDARVHLFTEQPERYRIEVLLNPDVVVEVQPAELPVRVLIRCGRERTGSGRGM